MKTIDLTQHSISVEQLLEMASQENMVLRRNGEEFILAAIDDFDSEIESLRYNKEFTAFLEDRTKDSKISIDEARAILLEQE